MEKITSIEFPPFTGTRCLMMPYIQGDPESVPDEYLGAYSDIIENVFIQKGDIGFLTIDEDFVPEGQPHRGARAKFGRALHTEAGRFPGKFYGWGGGNTWGGSHNVTLDPDVEIIIANNQDSTCAVWDAVQEDTTIDGDIGHLSDKYPYEDAIFLKAGDVFKIGILTPHESMPVQTGLFRQFLRIVSSGVHGREDYFTENRLLSQK